MFVPRHAHGRSDMSGMDDMSSTGSSMADMKMYFHGTIGGDMLWFSSWVPASAGATVGVCIALFVFAIIERYLMAFRRACDVAWQKGQVGFKLPASSGPYTDTSPLPSASSPSAPKYTSIDIETPLDLSKDITESSSPTYASSTSDSTDEKGHGGSGGGGRRMRNVPAHLPRAVRRGMDRNREGRWSRPYRWTVDVPRGLLQSLQTLVHYLLMLVVMSFNIWWILAVVVGSGVGEIVFGRFGPIELNHH